MVLPNKRPLNFALVLACGCMMAYALFSQHVLGLDPCPLCVFQRIAVIALGLVLLIAALHNSSGWGGRVYAVIAGLTATAGTGIAAWHVRLQNLPPEDVPSCGPGLSYIVDTFPLKDAISLIFKGSGECAEVLWSFLGLSMPAWVAISMLALGVAAVWNNLRSNQ